MEQRTQILKQMHLTKNEMEREVTLEFVWTDLSSLQHVTPLGLFVC